MHMKEEYQDINSRTFSEVHQFVKKLNIMPVLDRHTELASLLQGKTVMAAVMAMVEEGKVQAAAPEWGSIPCDVRLRSLRLVPSRFVRAWPQSC